MRRGPSLQRQLRRDAGGGGCRARACRRRRATGRCGAGRPAGGKAARCGGGAGGARPDDGWRNVRPNGGVMTAEIVQLTSEMAPELASDERALIVDVEGFEGALDLLLTLARAQEVDLRSIS